MSIEQEINNPDKVYVLADVLRRKIRNTTKLRKTERSLRSGTKKSTVKNTFGVHNHRRTKGTEPIGNYRDSSFFLLLAVY